MIHRLIAWFKLGRYLFLGGGFVLYNLGVAVAFYQGITVDWATYGLGQLIVTSTQLMVHYSNDYFDFEADSLNQTFTPWSGGSRILPNQMLPRPVALITALILALIAVAGIFILIWRFDTTPGAVIVLIIALALSWAYSAPPWRLHSRSLGELTASLVVAVLTPLAGYYLQAKTLSALILLSTLPLFFMQLNMLISVHMPDATSDRLAGKQTLVVRMGEQRTSNFYLLNLLLAYGVMPILYLFGLPGLPAAAVMISLPLGLYLGRRMWLRHWALPENFASIAFWSIGLLMVTAFAELVAFYIDALYW